LIGKRLEIVEKPLFARNQAKTHSSHPRWPFRGQLNRGIVPDPVYTPET
jgi:hypothetical protein